MKKLLTIVLISIIGIDVITYMPLAFLTNIWFIDIFSHFRLQILILLWLVSWILLFPYLKYYWEKMKENKLTISDRKYSFVAFFNFIIPIVLILFMSEPLSTTLWNNGKIKNTIWVKIFYQNIQREVDKEDIELIYTQIKESNPEIITVVENSYEFHDYLYEKWWKRISGNKWTECGWYIKSDNEREIVSEIIKTDVNYDICKFIYDNVNIFVVHPHPPMNKWQYDRWKWFFGELVWITDKVLLEDHKLIIVWDFNATIYNSHFRESFNHIYKKSYYSRHSVGLLDFFLTLPIDHVLSNIKNIWFNTLEYTSSDHKGFIIWY